MPTAGELRAKLKVADARWTLDQRFSDADVVPRRASGGDLTQAQKVKDLPPTDIRPHVSVESANVFLTARRVARNFLTMETLGPTAASRVASLVRQGFSGLGAGAPTSVDWRNRFGWPWITNVKDQGPCESCWCFSAVDTVESMTRIAHGVWALRSEGDVHDGMGQKCVDKGWPTHAFDWMKANGVADPGCWPYGSNDAPYNPTPDRSGRTVRLNDYVILTDVQSQKDWLDTVGPIAACFTIYDDFYGYGSGVYTQTSNTVDGGHCIVIVGYDEAKQAWLVRNSWGAGWGMAGYCWFGYGQCDIDNNAKYGVVTSSVNPDPWSKRRVHNGVLYESGDGAMHRNFEVWTRAPGNAIHHYWRDGTSLAWSVAETEASDCAFSPSVTATTYNRNFEYVYSTTSGRLHHWFFDQTNGKWNDGGVFGPNNASCVASFIQSDYGTPGNFEVVVLCSDGTLQHWWRIDGPPWTWSLGAAFGSNVAVGGRTLVQRPDHGLDYVCVTKSGMMQRFYRDDPHGFVWKAGETFGSDITNAPVMIQGQFAAADETVQGNYELCVAVGGQIQHWWRDNQGTGSWFQSATFGANVVEVLGLIESSYGFNLELVAWLQDGSLQHYWRDGSGWNAGVVFGSTTK